MGVRPFSLRLVSAPDAPRVLTLTRRAGNVAVADEPAYEVLTALGPLEQAACKLSPNLIKKGNQPTLFPVSTQKQATLELP